MRNNSLSNRWRGSAHKSYLLGCWPLINWICLVFGQSTFSRYQVLKRRDTRRRNLLSSNDFGGRCDCKFHICSRLWTKRKTGFERLECEVRRRSRFRIQREQSPNKNWIADRCWNYWRTYLKFLLIWTLLPRSFQEYASLLPRHFKNLPGPTVLAKLLRNEFWSWNQLWPLFWTHGARR